MSTPITVSVLVNAPIKKAWDYFSLPEHITQWCQASADWHAPKASNDLREGGKFSTTMAAKDGSFSFDFGGTYTKVVPNEMFAYMMEDGRTCSVSFDETGDETFITETFDPETINPVEMQEAGWQAILNSFKTYIESH